MIKKGIILSMLFCNVACQHYTIRSYSTSSIDELKGAKYKIVSVVEGESDPTLSESEQKIVFKDVNSQRRTYFDNALLKEIEKNFGKSDKNIDEILMKAKINRQIRCKYIKAHRPTEGKVDLGYKQLGEVLINISGVSNKTNKEVFNVDIEYDMDGHSSGIIKSFVCDSYDKVSKIINEKILPLAVKEIGQNRIIDK